MIISGTTFFSLPSFFFVWYGLCKHNEAIQQKQIKDPYYYNEYNTLNNRLEVAHMIHQWFLDFWLTAWPATKRQKTSLFTLNNYVPATGSSSQEIYTAVFFFFQGATFEKAGFDTAETKLIKSNRIDEYIFQFWDSKK